MDRKKKVMVQNRRARHEYYVEETMEAGLSLFGTEVKSIRQGKANLTDAYIRVRSGEAYVVGMHISPYEQGNIFNRDPLRDKKLLLHKREIAKLNASTMREGYTLKKLYDKRESLKQRDDKREMERAVARAGRRGE